MFAVQILQVVVGLGFRKGDGKAATGKAEAVQSLNVWILFQNDVLAHNTDVGNAICNVSGDVVVANEENFEVKMLGNHPEFAVRTGNPDAAGLEKVGRVVGKATGTLNGETQALTHGTENGKG